MLLDAVVWLLEQLHDPRTQVARLTDPNAALLVEEGENPAGLRNGLNRFQGEIVRPLGKVPLGLHALYCVNSGLEVAIRNYSENSGISTGHLSSPAETRRAG